MSRAMRWRRWWSVRRAAGAAIVALLLVAVFAAATPQPVEAFLKSLFKPLVQTIALSIRRGHTYERLEQQRDREVAEVRERAHLLERQAQLGWVDPATLERERARYKAWEQGVTQRTEREKRISRDTYNRAIGVTWREAAIDAVVQVPGVSSRAAGVIQGIARGQSPLRAALDTLTQSLAGGAPPPDQLAALRTQWQSTREALRGVRLPGAVSLEERLGDLITRSDRLRPGPGGIGEAAFQRELESFRRAARETNALVRSAKGVIDEWTVAEARISPAKFQRDARWQAIAAEIATLEGSRAGKALLAGIARKAEANVRARIEASGVQLDEEAMTVLVATVAAEYVVARVDAQRGGKAPADIDLDALVRRVVGEHLATAGITPPEPTPAVRASTPTATSTAQPASTARPAGASGPSGPSASSAAAPAAAPPASTPRPAAATPTPRASAPTPAPTPVAGPPPVITGVTYPSEVKARTTNNTTTITWSGQVKLPARVSWIPVTCDFDCDFGSTPITSAQANSVTAQSTPYCGLYPARGKFVFDLSIVDGNGRSPYYRITFYCNP